MMSVQRLTELIQKHLLLTLLRDFLSLLVCWLKTPHFNMKTTLDGE